jgi:adenine-specific DNA-methyltransferase
MAYVGTGVISRNLGVTNKQLYDLIDSGRIEAPIKERGRYRWSEKNASDVVRALSLRSKGLILYELEDKKYLGNKAQYSAFLRELSDRYCPDFRSFGDLFAGVGGADREFTDKELTVNDILYSSYINLVAWYSSESADMDKLSSIVDRYNDIRPFGEGYVTKNYSGKYFGLSTARKIDFIRDDIKKKRTGGQINEREEAILISALLHGIDQAANIYGHYEAFKKPPVVWNSLELNLPNIPVINHGNNRIFNTDANMLASYVHTDVTYIDCPNDSRQYCDMYHLPETIALWEKPELKGKTLKPVQPYKKSQYCRKDAPDAFRELIDGLRAKLILVNMPKTENEGNRTSSNRISLSEMLGVLEEKGRVHIEFPALNEEVEQMFLTLDFGMDKEVKAEDTVKGGVIVCETGKKPRPFTEMPLNFNGDEKKDIRLITPFFPVDVRTAIGVYPESFQMVINADAENKIFSDKDRHTVGIMKKIGQEGDAFIKKTEQLIREYGLSLSGRHGYEYYDSTQEAGLADYNREAYSRLRDDFNAMDEGDDGYYERLYLLLVYGYGMILRFNRKGMFNLTVGKRDWTDQLRLRLKRYVQALEKENVDYRRMTAPETALRELGPGDLAVICPSESELMVDEKSIVRMLSQLRKQDTRFAFIYDSSNGCNGIEDWKRKNADRLRMVKYDPDRPEKEIIINY